MTIKRLPDFLRTRKVSKMGRESPKDTAMPLYLNQLHGRKVAIETAGLIYKQNYAAVNSVIERHSFIYRDGEGWTKPAVEEVHTMFKVFFTHTVKKLLDSGIKPVFVLEGKSPKMKQGTVKKRSETRSSNEDKVSSVQKDIDLKAYKDRLRNTYMPNHVHVNIVIEVLTNLNVPTIRAKHEAEGVCAHLVNLPESHELHCDCAFSDDYDIFMYGCKAVIRGMRQADAKVGHFEVTGIAYRDILHALGLLPMDKDGNPLTYTQEQFQRAHEKFRLMCILSGTDYSENVPNIGPAKILKLIMDHDVSTFEEICKIEPKFEIIPHDEIITTLQENTEYGIVHIPVTPA